MTRNLEVYREEQESSEKGRVGLKITLSVPKHNSFLEISIWATGGAKWVNLHSKHTHTPATHARKQAHVQLPHDYDSDVQNTLVSHTRASTCTTPTRFWFWRLKHIGLAHPLVIFSMHFVGPDSEWPVTPRSEKVIHQKKSEGSVTKCDRNWNLELPPI